MSNETLQSICQLVIAVGLIISAAGGFGAYYFGGKVEKEKEAKSAYSGKLKQRKDIKKLFSGKEHIYPKLEFGDSGAILVYAGPKGQPLFKMAEENSITIELEEGDLKVSTMIRDKSGKIVAVLERSEWKVNQNNSWDRNYTGNALEVKDPGGDIVLQVALFEDRVRFQGIFYDSKGNGIGIGKVYGPSGWGGGIEITGPKHPEIKLKIEPLFKYPSELHFGERIKK